MAMAYKFIVRLICNQCSVHEDTTARIIQDVDGEMFAIPDLPDGWVEDKNRKFSWTSENSVALCPECASMDVLSKDTPD